MTIAVTRYRDIEAMARVVVSAIEAEVDEEGGVPVLVSGGQLVELNREMTT